MIEDSSLGSISACVTPTADFTISIVGLALAAKEAVCSGGREGLPLNMLRSMLKSCGYSLSMMIDTWVTVVS